MHIWLLISFIILAIAAVFEFAGLSSPGASEVRILFFSGLAALAATLAFHVTRSGRTSSDTPARDRRERQPHRRPESDSERPPRRP